MAECVSGHMSNRHVTKNELLKHRYELEEKPNSGSTGRRPVSRKTVDLIPNRRRTRSIHSP